MSLSEPEAVAVAAAESRYVIKTVWPCVMAAEFCSVILSALDSSVAGGTAAIEVISRVLTSAGSRSWPST